jgi:hypothetical protein
MKHEMPVRAARRQLVICAARDQSCHIIIFKFLLLVLKRRGMLLFIALYVSLVISVELEASLSASFIINDDH